MKQFDKLPIEERRKYEDLARPFIYKGFEPRWKQHDRMISAMARALYKIDQMKMDGSD